MQHMSVSEYLRVISCILHKPCFSCQQHPLFSKSPRWHICFSPLLYPGHRHSDLNVQNAFVLEIQVRKYRISLHQIPGLQI